MPNEQHCTIQMHALASKGAGQDYNMASCPVHLSSLSSYHSLVALQYIEGEQGQPLGSKLCESGYGPNFLIDTEDLQRILLTQGFRNNIVAVSEYVTTA